MSVHAPPTRSRPLVPPLSPALERAGESEDATQSPCLSPLVFITPSFRPLRVLLPNPSLLSLERCAATKSNSSGPEPLLHDWSRLHSYTQLPGPPSGSPTLASRLSCCCLSVKCQHTICCLSVKCQLLLICKMPTLLICKMSTIWCVDQLLPSCCQLSSAACM